MRYYIIRLSGDKNLPPHYMFSSGNEYLIGVKANVKPNTYPDEIVYIKPLYPEGFRHEWAIPIHKARIICITKSLDKSLQYLI